MTSESLETAAASQESVEKIQLLWCYSKAKFSLVKTILLQSQWEQNAAFRATVQSWGRARTLSAQHGRSPVKGTWSRGGTQHRLFPPGIAPFPGQAGTWTCQHALERRNHVLPPPCSVQTGISGRSTWQHARLITSPQTLVGDFRMV